MLIFIICLIVAVLLTIPLYRRVWSGTSKKGFPHSIINYVVWLRTIWNVCCFYALNRNSPKRRGEDKYQKYFDAYDADLIFRRTYNCMFRLPGLGKGDKFLLYLISRKYITVIGVYLLLIAFISMITFGGIYHSLGRSETTLSATKDQSNGKSSTIASSPTVKNIDKEKKSIEGTPTIVSSFSIERVDKEKQSTGKIPTIVSSLSVEGIDKEKQSDEKISTIVSSLSLKDGDKGELSDGKIPTIVSSLSLKDGDKEKQSDGEIPTIVSSPLAKDVDKKSKYTDDIERSTTFMMSGDYAKIFGKTGNLRWLVSFSQWFIITVISSIVLGLITKKLIERRPSIVFPPQIYFDPNSENFQVWCWNRDIAFLSDFRFSFEVEMRFTSEGVRDAFAKGEDYSVYSFWFKINSPPRTLEKMMGFLITSQKPSDSENSDDVLQKSDDVLQKLDKVLQKLDDSTKDKTPMKTIDCITNNERKQECYLGVETKYQYNGGEKYLFDQDEENLGVYRAIRVIVYVKDSVTGDETTHVVKYAISPTDDIDDASLTFRNDKKKRTTKRRSSQPRIVCGISRDLPGVDGVFYPNNWYDRNLLNMQVIDEIGSQDYQARVEEDKKRAEEHSYERRLTVEECSAKGCKFYDRGCPLRRAKTV